MASSQSSLSVAAHFDSLLIKKSGCYLKVYLCLFLCQPIHVSFCLPTHLLVCLPACLAVFLTAYLSPCLPACLFATCWLGCSLSVRCLLLSWSVLVQINQFPMLILSYYDSYEIKSTVYTCTCMCILCDTSWWPRDIIVSLSDIDLKKAAKLFAQKYSCGSSLTGPDEIVIQGDVLDDLLEFIPEKWPEVQYRQTNKQTFMHAQEGA